MEKICQYKRKKFSDIGIDGESDNIGYFSLNDRQIKYIGENWQYTQLLGSVPL